MNSLFADSLRLQQSWIRVNNIFTITQQNRQQSCTINQQFHYTTRADILILECAGLHT